MFFNEFNELKTFVLARYIHSLLLFRQKTLTHQGTWPNSGVPLTLFHHFGVHHMDMNIHMLLPLKHFWILGSHLLKLLFNCYRWLNLSLPSFSGLDDDMSCATACLQYVVCYFSHLFTIWISELSIVAIYPLFNCCISVFLRIMWKLLCSAGETSSQVYGVPLWSFSSLFCWDNFLILVHGFPPSNAVPLQ